MIKEALEMSNRMELQRGLLADVYGTPLMNLQLNPKQFVTNNIDPVDNESDVERRRNLTKRTRANCDYFIRSSFPTEGRL